MEKGPLLASSSAFRFCLSGRRRRRPSPVNDVSLPVMNAREQRRKACPQDASDRDLEYHRLCVNSNRSILSHVTQNALAKFVFANDLPCGTHTYVTRPEEVQLPSASEFMIKSSDGQLLHSYWLPAPSDESSQFTVLYLHGASGNIGHRLEVAKIIQKGMDADILLLDYRGFGRSTGQPSELGTYLDAQAGLDWILAGCSGKRPRNRKILVFGTSLGAAIAMHLASQEDNARHLHAVIVENCFTSICEISRYYVPNWARPLLDLVKSTLVCPMFDCLSKASRIRCPVLYLVGLRDPVVPSWMSQVLFSQTHNSCRKAIREFVDGRHNDLPSATNYCLTICEFLECAVEDVVKSLNGVEGELAGKDVLDGPDHLTSDEADECAASPNPSCLTETPRTLSLSSLASSGGSSDCCSDAALTDEESGEELFNRIVNSTSDALPPGSSNNCEC